jgi:hypothetical protein
MLLLLARVLFALTAVLLVVRLGRLRHLNADLGVEWGLRQCDLRGPGGERHRGAKQY